MATELKSPQQYIYDEVFLTSSNLGYDTYDYLPPGSTSYPFVFVGEQFDQDVTTKSVIYGYVTQTIHVYHSHKNRRELTDMMNQIKASLRRLKSAGPYSLAIRSINAQTMMDDTTANPLLHGTIEVEFRFN